MAVAAVAEAVSSSRVYGCCVGEIAIVVRLDSYLEETLDMEVAVAGSGTAEQNDSLVDEHAQIVIVLALAWAGESSHDEIGFSLRGHCGRFSAVESRKDADATWDLLFLASLLWQIDDEQQPQVPVLAACGVELGQGPAVMLVRRAMDLFWSSSSSLSPAFPE